MGYNVHRRLTEVEVLELRRFADEGWISIRHNGVAIALAYGVSVWTVRGIGAREGWSWLPEAPDSPFYG